MFWVPNQTTNCENDYTIIAAGIAPMKL